MSKITFEEILKKLTCNSKDCFQDDYYVNHNIPDMHYLNLPIMQNHNIIFPFFKLIRRLQPSRIIEIGTAHGGLTLMIRDLMDLNGLQFSDLITYDVINPTGLIHEIEKSNLNIKVEHKNVFDSNYNLIDNTLIDLIKGEGISIILCDGGNKKEEFKTLSQYMKSGDIIMAHDYAYDETHYSQKIHNKIWYWHEIKNADITQSCKDNNLVDYMEPDFSNVVWSCKIKK
jgi:hypothetical protein